jgi:diguanylate cyclase (GGDEF)-like protein
MVTALIAAAAAALTLAVSVIVTRWRGARMERRFEAVLGQLDDHLGAISESLERVVERSSDTRAKGVDDLELTVDFDELLRRLTAEAAARTGAEAAAVHVRGPGGTHASTTFGADDRSELLEAPLGRGAGPFRAVTINWSFQPVYEQGADEFASALVVPIAEGGVETGTLAAYARAPGAFGADQVRALEALADEAGPAIASARRFAEAQRTLTDDLTGLPDRTGYEVELERAVARAQESGLPLSLLVLRREDGEAPTDANDPSTDRALQQVAALLRNVTRTTDVVCRLGSERFGIVLPETTGDAARRFYVRLKEEASRAPFPARQLTFAAGLVEWRPNEPSDALNARASAAVGRSRVDDLELVAPPAAPVSEAMPSQPGPRERFQERVAQEITWARRLEQPLALLIIDVEDLPADEKLGGEAADRLLADVEAHVGRSLQRGDVTFGLGDGEFGVILTGSRAAEAEVVLSELQATLETEPQENIGWLAVSAGITELATGDDAASVFARAEHALWRAKRAGRGTVVVAMPGEEPEG